MEQLLLVNPSKRRGKRRRKSLPPRGAGGRFLKRKARSGKRRKTRRTNPVPALAMNPRRRRRRSNPSPRRRYRRNPIGGGFGRGFVRQLTAPLMPAVLGAGGAIANDFAFGFLPLPATFKAGYIGVASKATLAVALGMVLARVVGANNAKQMTAGALTVLAYQTIKPVVASVVPGLGYAGAGQVLMGGVGEYISELPSSLSGVPNSLNEYISGANTYGYSDAGESDLY